MLEILTFNSENAIHWFILYTFYYGSNVPYRAVFDHIYLASPGSSLAGGGNLSNRKRGSIAHSLSLSPYRRPDMTKIRQG